jgi:hypothetical protein
MIVGLTGYSKVGKDTLCEMLQNYERQAFADALKSQITSMLKHIGITADVWGEDKEDWRDMLVFWGRKMRSRDRDYWLKQLYMRMGPDADKRVCITDVRYVNEVRWIQKQGGLVIGIDRPGFGPANEEEGMSIREVRIQHPEIVWIQNNGTPQEMATLARKIINENRTDRRPGGFML